MVPPFSFGDCILFKLVAPNKFSMAQPDGRQTLHR